MANNPALYNAVIAGITGGNQQRWLTDSSPADYSIFQTITDTIAGIIDTGIPAISGGATPSQASLMQSICQGVFSSRTANTLRHRLPAVAQAIIDLYSQLDTTLETVPDEGGGGGGGDPATSLFSLDGFEIDVLPTAIHTGGLSGPTYIQQSITLEEGQWYSITVEVIIKKPPGPANEPPAGYYVYRQQIEAFREFGADVSMHYAPVTPPVEFPVGEGNYAVSVTEYGETIVVQVTIVTAVDVAYAMYIGHSKKPIPA